MYSITAVYALPFRVAPIPAVRYDLNGGLPTCLWYDSLYIRIIWLLLCLLNLCKPDMVPVSSYVEKFCLSLNLSLMTTCLLSIRISLACARASKLTTTNKCYTDLSIHYINSPSNAYIHRWAGSSFYNYDNDMSPVQHQALIWTNHQPHDNFIEELYLKFSLVNVPSFFREVTTRKTQISSEPEFVIIDCSDPFGYKNITESLSCVENINQFWKPYNIQSMETNVNLLPHTRPSIRCFC